MGIDGRLLSLYMDVCEHVYLMVDIIWLTSIYVHWGIVRTLSDNDIEW